MKLKKTTFLKSLRFSLVKSYIEYYRMVPGVQQQQQLKLILICEVRQKGKNENFALILRIENKHRLPKMKKKTSFFNTGVR